MKIAELYKLFLSSPIIVTDTRRIVPNSIFFALKGDNFNGNKFAEEAISAGTSYAVIDEDIDSNNPQLIKVENVLLKLQELANYHRKQLSIPIIGITGTNGKTTTKELLLITLAQKYNVIATEGNLNNHIGVPLTLLKITKQHEIAIIEMGANHLGEIAELCQIAEPNYGIVTNVGKAHLEGFGSFENIISTKSELYRYVSSVKGTNFLLIENKEITSLLKDYNFIEYSCNNSKTLNYGTGTVSNSYLEFTLYKLQSSNITETTIETKMVGLYNQTNILAAITISNHFGVSLKQIKFALESYTPNNNRSQLEKTKKNQLILDAYNANPTSVINALENINQIQSPNKLIILGDMLELGSFSIEEHQSVVEQLLSYKIETVLIGKEFQKTNCKEANHITKFKSIQDFIESDKIKNIKGSLILIKGSRGMKLEQLVQYL